MMKRPARLSINQAAAQRARALCLLCIGIGWVAACGTEESGVMGPGDTPLEAPEETPLDSLEESSGPAIVSDPAQGGEPSAVASLVMGRAPADGSEVVYISLAPESLDGGAEVRATNRTSGLSLPIPVVNGGFDPVPIAAAAGDVLELLVTLGSLEVARWSETVPSRRPPIIVRTVPPRGRRDVPVASSMQVVFSEPVVPTTVNTGTVRLLRDGVPGSGRVEPSPDGLAAWFTPDEPLAPDSEYALTIGPGVMDLDGDTVESIVTVEFTTVAAVGADVSGLSQIAFVTLNSGIHVMSADGSGVSKLTAIADDYGPAWSPDGLRLAFERNSGVQSNYDIFVMNRDGSGVVGLTRDGHNQRPTWSPDGARIAFQRNGGLSVMNADGSHLTALTDFPSGVDAWEPAWSPDGSRIAFVSRGTIDDVTSDIYVMNADGSDVRRLTDHPAADDSPAWSPDGTRLAFTSSRDYGPGDIYVMNADGSGVASVTSDPVADFSPTWSPDGTRIAFSSERTWSEEYPGAQIYVIDVAGSGLVRLTSVRSPASGQGPAWSPVGGVPPAPSLALQKIGGDGQVDTVRATLPHLVQVRVLQGSTPVGGVPIVWVSNDWLGSIAPTATTTDANGVASATWSLGPKAGFRTATALATVGTQALAASFTATGTPGAAAVVRSFMSLPPVAVAGTTLFMRAVVLDADVSYANPVSGMAVDFAVTMGGGAVAPARDTTDWSTSCGGGWPCAWASFTLGQEEGVNSATATVPAMQGHPPLTFTTMAVAAAVGGGLYLTNPNVWPPADVFAPADVTVPSGRTVGWMLGDPGDSWEHNVTFEDDPTQPTSSPNLAGGATFLRTFQGTPRVIRYRCTIHSTSFTEGMVGTVTVQ